MSENEDFGMIAQAVLRVEAEAIREGEEDVSRERLIEGVIDRLPRLTRDLVAQLQGMSDEEMRSLLSRI